MPTQQHRWILGGGLASGKSAVCSRLAAMGVATIDADAIGHAVLERDGPAYDAVSSRWPEVVSDGRIDRRALADIVFADPGELAELEGITHPYIFDTISREVEKVAGTVVVEIPILANRLGSGWSRIVVDSSDTLKMERAVNRGMDERDARARLAAQPNRGEWLAAADLVIPNHGPLSALETSVTLVAPHL